MLKSIINFSDKKTIGEALAFYVAFLLFFIAILISFDGAIGKALMGDNAQAAEGAYYASFWIQQAVTSVFCLLLLYNVLLGKNLPIAKFWHLYTLTLLFCVSPLGLTAGLVPATLATMLEKE